MSRIGFLAQEVGLTPVQMALSAVMFIAWFLTYVFIFTQCQREKSYGLPMLCVFWNITWEAIFSFNPYATEDSAFLWGNRLWLAGDVLITWQVLAHGRRSQTHPFMQRWFWPIALTTFGLVILGLPLFLQYTRDVFGGFTSFLMNLVMSALFIRMALDRPDLRGLSYPAAWLKMIGTFAGGLLTITWLPTMYEGGVLKSDPSVVAPPSYAFLAYLIGTIVLLDVVYILVLRKRRRELAAGAP